MSLLASYDSPRAEKGDRRSTLNRQVRTVSTPPREEHEPPTIFEESTKIKLDGHEYDSIEEAIEATAIPKSTLLKHLEDGTSWKDRAGIEHLATRV